jgi:uncharacterized membrane protein
METNQDQAPHEQAPAPEQQGEASGNKEKNTGMAVVAYLLFFVPLLTDAKDDPFVKFHVKQGLLVFILAVIAQLLNLTMVLMPVGLLVMIGVLVLVVLGIMHALNGEQEELPLIGKYAEKFTF